MLNTKCLIIACKATYFHRILKLFTLIDLNRLYAERHVTKPENRSPDFRLSEKPVAAVGTDGDSY